MTEPLRYQLAWDARDALSLADWWAETLGWQVEPTDAAFVQQMIDEGRATEADTQVHRGALVWRGAAAITPDLERGRDRQRILFQDVPESKTVKNRLHIDVRASDGDHDAARAALEARGATYLDTRRQGPHEWHVMQDPEGNEFCVSE